MKKNVIYILLIVILASTAVYLTRKPVKSTADFDGDALATDSLRIIEIIYEKNGVRTVLTKGLDGDSWFIKGDKPEKADINAVRAIKDFAATVSLTNVISENPEKAAKFGLDEKAANITVRRDDNRSVSFSVGSDDRDSSHSFIRITGDNKIYLGSLFPRYRIPSDTEGWKSKPVPEQKEEDAGTAE
jgi:hypothetical protein